MEIVFVLLMAFVGVSTVAGGSEQNIRKTYSRFQTVKRESPKYPGKHLDFPPRIIPIVSFTFGEVGPLGIFPQTSFILS